MMAIKLFSYFAVWTSWPIFSNLFPISILTFQYHILGLLLLLEPNYQIYVRRWWRTSRTSCIKKKKNQFLNVHCGVSTKNQCTKLVQHEINLNVCMCFWNIKKFLFTTSSRILFKELVKRSICFSTKICTENRCWLKCGTDK